MRFDLRMRHGNRFKHAWLEDWRNTRRKIFI
jgi:hypothetical protein